MAAPQLLTRVEGSELEHRTEGDGTSERETPPHWEKRAEGRGEEMDSVWKTTSLKV